jgi:hypothetical protein
MADFSTPFGESGDKRFPTPTEQAEGFPCGPGERALFNGEFYRLEAEIGEVIEYAGITPTNSRMTQLREAINALIVAATGTAPDLSVYILMSQARARLPIFPDVLTADGKIGCFTTCPGVLRMPGGVTFQHRGIFPVTTVQTDFNTALSQTYHLRWDPTNGYRLRNLTDSAYNSGAVAENDVKFDSAYDDVLIARVTTNSSNVLTVTNLANKVRLYAEATAPAIYNDPINAPPSGRVLNHVINFARQGLAYLKAISPPGGGRDSDPNLDVTALDRYGITVFSQGWQRDSTNAYSAFGYRYAVFTN